MDCVEKRSPVDPKYYHPARNEKEICQVRMGKEKSLETKVLQLGFRYCKSLRGLDYTAFIEKNPEIAIGHIRKRVSDEQLYKRMELTIEILTERGFQK